MKGVPTSNLEILIGDQITPVDNAAAIETEDLLGSIRSQQSGLSMEKNWTHVYDWGLT
jgi:hypothetical protein